MGAGATVLPAEDQLAIGQLCVRYAMHFDAGDGRAFASLFAPDGEFVGPAGARRTGRQELEAMVSERHEAMPQLRHFPTSAVIEPAEHGALGSSYVIALRLDGASGLRLLTVGRYEDRYVKLPEGWRFQVRRYVPWVGPELSDRPLIEADDE
jgi:SnoaL-like domain